MRILCSCILIRYGTDHWSDPPPTGIRTANLKGEIELWECIMLLIHCFIPHTGEDNQLELDA